MEMMLNVFVDLLAPLPLLQMFIGVTLGIVVGAIPGLTGTMLIALSVPLTFYMDSKLALVLLIGMYVGGITGGLISATLLRMPGSPSSIITTFDGYPMAKGGQPGKAISYGIFASFVGGIISWLFLALLAPPLAKVAIRLNMLNYFAMIVMALAFIVSVSQGELIKGLISGLLGLLVSTPGLDPITAGLRLDFGMEEMAGGFNLLPVLIGLFAVSQAITDILHIDQQLERLNFTFRQVIQGMRNMLPQMFNMIRSSVIGTWVGILPGIGANIGSIMAYTTAKNMSKNPEKFGKGAAEGIVASEAANNATICGALVPLVTMGIPGSIIDAILLGALIIHDVQPGPLLFKTNPDMVYTIINSALISNFLMFGIMIFATVLITKVIFVRKAYLLPVILLCCVIGSFAMANRMFDVWVMLAFGLLGYFLERANVPLAPFVIGIVLGPIAEDNLRSGLMGTAGDFTPLFTDPISASFLLFAFISLVWPLYKTAKQYLKEKSSL